MSFAVARVRSLRKNLLNGEGASPHRYVRLFDALAKLIQPRVNELTLEQLTSTAFAFGVMRVRPRELMSALRAASVRRTARRTR